MTVSSLNLSAGDWLQTAPWAYLYSTKDPLVLWLLWLHMKVVMSGVFYQSSVLHNQELRRNHFSFCCSTVVSSRIQEFCIHIKWQQVHSNINICSVCLLLRCCNHCKVILNWHIIEEKHLSFDLILLFSPNFFLRRLKNPAYRSIM